jgi:hypothetical protein
MRRSPCDFSKPATGRRAIVCAVTLTARTVGTFLRLARQQRVAPRHLRFQQVDEVFAGGNIVDIDKKPLGREGLLHAAERHLGESRLITATIVDENPATHAIKRR